MQLDENLLEYMRAGKVVLFLGAGASKEAQSKEGEKIPDAIELGRKISQQFLSGKYADRDFKTICDFAINRKSTLDLQGFLHETFFKFHPAPFHSLIPKFVWSGILTTNYDLVVERAYAEASVRWSRLSEQYFRFDKWRLCRG